MVLWLKDSFTHLNFPSDSRDKYSGKAADIWALGITLYCFIFGKVCLNACVVYISVVLYSSCAIL